ncbi:hypothetical protein ACHAW5_002131 [Stephanodiscus triporus]|uniref:subtilisin n=1 Tax=Stephanodiscus triporus TaxID=2934178 RepID=A0ABD3NR16_9STRA
MLALPILPLWSHPAAIPAAPHGEYGPPIRHTAAAAFIQDANLPGFTTSSDDSHVSYIVTLADDCESPADACEALARENGGTVGHVYEEIFPGCLLTLPAWTQAQAQAQAQDEFITALSDSSEVEFVEEEQLYFAIGEGNIIDPIYYVILDTGIRGDHEEFDGIINATDTCHFSVISSEPDALKDGKRTRHFPTATLTLGFFFSYSKSLALMSRAQLVVETYGVSSDCRLCLVKVLNASGFGTNGGIIGAMDRIIKHCKNNTSSPCVISMSLGGDYSESLNRAVAKTVAADACGLNRNGTSPASKKTAITVGSIGNTDIKSKFSNFGECVDVYAPGEFIESAWSTTKTSKKKISGTSMATPHVAGIVAGIRSKFPELNTAQVARVIIGSAAQLNSGILLAHVDGVSCTRMPTSTPTTVQVQYHQHQHHQPQVQHSLRAHQVHPAKVPVHPKVPVLQNSPR